MDIRYNIKCGAPLIMDHEYAHCANTVEFQGFGKVQEISSVYLLLGRPVQLKIPLTEDFKVLVTAPITAKSGRVKAQLMECKLASMSEEYEYVRYSDIFEVVITPSLAEESEIEVTDPRLELIYTQMHEAYLSMLSYEHSAQTYAESASASATTATTKAGEAASSATAAATSASTASGAATTATTKASEASASATSAASSASTATTKASEAAASATAAQASVSEVTDIRVGADGTTYASAGNAVRGQITDLKEDLNQNALYGNLLGYGKTNYGKAINNTTGALTTNNEFDTTDFIPVSEGELLYSNITTRYAYYDNEKTFVSTSTFVTCPLLFAEISDVRYSIVPTGATYFRICYRKSLVDSVFLCHPNAYDIVHEQKINGLLPTTLTNFWDIGTVIDNKSINSGTGALVTNADYKTTDFIPIKPGSTVYGYGGRFYCYDENQTAISGTTGVLNNYGEALSNGMHYYKIPEGAVFFRISASKTANKFQMYSTDIFETLLHESEKTRKLYTLGDSITRGMYAEQGASSSSGPTSQGYPYWIGKLAGYEIVNLGVSGSGWAYKGGNNTEESGEVDSKYVVDNNTFSDADIITMAWGVNDWKGAAQNVVLGDMTSEPGDGTVIGNMKYCIETLVTQKPTAQLIVLLPMNTNRQWSGMDTMTLANNWAFGYAYRNNQTLQDYRDAIKECAEYYNVKVVDLEEVCPINRLNIRQVVGDGLHPTQAFYKQMGQALAPLIC